MNKHLFHFVQSSLGLLVFLLLIGCQSLTPTPEPLTPTALPTFQPLMPMADVKSLDSSVLITAFQKLDRSESYRVTWANVTDSDSRTVYIFEKKGQGKYRVIQSPQSKEYRKEILFVGGQVYEQYEEYFWRLVTDNSYSFITNEFGLFLIPLMELGCDFEPNYPPKIEYAYYGVGPLSPFIVIGYTYSSITSLGYRIIDPTPVCEVAINAEGLPYRLISTHPNYDWAEYVGVVLFSDFDGENIDPISVPQIYAPPPQ